MDNSGRAEQCMSVFYICLFTAVRIRVFPAIPLKGLPMFGPYHLWLRLHWLQLLGLHTSEDITHSTLLLFLLARDCRESLKSLLHITLDTPPHLTHTHTHLPHGRPSPFYHPARAPHPTALPVHTGAGLMFKDGNLQQKMHPPNHEVRATNA